MLYYIITKPDREIMVKEVFKGTAINVTVTQPQASYTFGLKHRWTYFLRILPDIHSLALSSLPLQIGSEWPIGQRHTGTSSPFGRIWQSKPFQ